MGIFTMSGAVRHLDFATFPVSRVVPARHWLSGRTVAWFFLFGMWSAEVLCSAALVWLFRFVLDAVEPPKSPDSLQSALYAERSLA
jgi:hypothetical protein